MAIKTLDTVVTVPEDRAVMLQLPPDVATGQQRIIAIIEEPAEPQAPTKSLAEEFPVFPGGKWPDEVSLRREDMYGDDGR